MPEDNKEKLKGLLMKLFQFESEDLDFGIYRIMNKKRDEVRKFIEKDLIKAIDEKLADYSTSNKAEIEGELESIKQEIIETLGDKAISKSGDIVKEYVDSPIAKKYLAKKSELKEIRVNEQEHNELFSQIHTFFSRYYQDGDFISQRRQSRKNKYSIPYNGDEVYLYWANNDQYYVKTDEYFKNYYFKARDYKVDFKITDAEIDPNNIKTEDRYFIIADEGFEFDEKEKKFIVPFEYRGLTSEETKKLGSRDIQKKLLNKAEEAVLKEIEGKAIKESLLKKEKISKDKEVTVLNRQLNRYVNKNSYDYFIHKDLKGFLIQELDYYIKNEVLLLDDFLEEKKTGVERYVMRAKVIKEISEKIIDFLAQIEEFQKKLFEKKKFILKSDYCITLDYIDEKLYPEVLKNKDQLDEWKKLFAFDFGEESKKLKSTLAGHSGKNIEIELLKQNPTLVIDTKFFDDEFKFEVLSGIEDLDESINGILINSENFQALKILTEKYKKGVKCCYIDPPYNTGDSEILYKNHYPHSSWLTLLENRMTECEEILDNSAITFVAIDDFEMVDLCRMIDTTFPNYRRDMIVVNHHPQGGKAKVLANTHEYMLVLSPSYNQKTLIGDSSFEDREERPFKRSGTAESNFRYGRPNSFYAILVDDSNTVIGLEKPPEKDDADYPKDNTKEGNKRIYPIGKDGSERVWRKSYENCLPLIDEKKLMCTDSDTIYQIIEAEDRNPALFSNWIAKKYNAGTYGANLLRNIMGYQNPFSYPKSVFTVYDALNSIQDNGGTYIDYFAGSGTTGHAILKLNKEHGKRKFILVEMGQYFDTVLKPRIEKVIFSDNWKDGTPLDNNGSRKQIIKYFSLESYEDSLNNIDFSIAGGTQKTLEDMSDYKLNYMLDFESRESPTRLNLDRLKNPFDYKLLITTEGVQEKRDVDLVETFNYLLGLHVMSIKRLMDGNLEYRVVTGNKANDEIVIIWRNTEKLDLKKDKKFIEDSILKEIPKERKPDKIYINDDSYVKGPISLDAEFKTLMGA